MKYLKHNLQTHRNIHQKTRQFIHINLRNRFRHRNLRFLHLLHLLHIIIHI
ncbi:hypothetical protein Hanom_Chr16g01435131 [Helianthus anomalus]